ncbi:hypothetical protein FB45DRAFT_393356 [Roridomyces roridus]|uniref:Uncharacterized protein n=1 Tax=Roridomyces roridus TaxID=1738132 RepID=A0AAD7B253_9AGAR|nr:hypothetical protein FB45DRAFT_393356 [Roridomyces roridus]
MGLNLCRDSMAFPWDRVWPANTPIHASHGCFARSATSTRRVRYTLPGASLPASNHLTWPAITPDTVPGGHLSQLSSGRHLLEAIEALQVMQETSGAALHDGECRYCWFIVPVASLSLLFCPVANPPLIPRSRRSTHSRADHLRWSAAFILPTSIDIIESPCFASRIVPFPSHRPRTHASRLFPTDTRHRARRRRPSRSPSTSVFQKNLRSRGVSPC